MIKGTLENGFEYEIAEDALDDYDLLMILHEIDAGETRHIDKAFDMILGEEQKQKLKAHIKEANGRVTVTAMMLSFAELLNTQELKN